MKSQDFDKKSSSRKHKEIYIKHTDDDDDDYDDEDNDDDDDSHRRKSGEISSLGEELTASL
jgi:hypothetical protein